MRRPRRRHRSRDDVMWGLRSSRTVVHRRRRCGLRQSSASLPLVSHAGRRFVRHQRRRGTGRPAAARHSAAWPAVHDDARSGCGQRRLATLVGAPLGFALARVTLPFKAPLRIALAAPAVLPPYVVALAWTYLARRSPATSPSPPGGAIVVLTVVFYPLSMLATEVGVRRVEPRLEEAALLVADAGRRAAADHLPLVLPTVTSPRRS